MLSLLQGVVGNPFGNAVSFLLLCFSSAKIIPDTRVTGALFNSSRDAKQGFRQI